MTRKSVVAAVLLMILVAANATSSSACSRCGAFGRSCRVRAVPLVRTQVIERGAPIVIFNNAGYAAEQGSTYYSRASYQGYARDYQLNPADILHESARLGEASAALAKLGVTSYSNLAAQAMADHKTLATLDARRAVAQQALSLVQPQADTYREKPGGHGYVLRQTENGTTVTSLDDEVARGGNGELDMTPQAVQLIQDRCLKSHGGTEVKGDLDLTNFGDHKFAATVVWEMINRALGPIGSSPEHDQMPLRGPALDADELAILFGYNLQLKYEGLIE